MEEIIKRLCTIITSLGVDGKIKSLMLYEFDCKFYGSAVICYKLVFADGPGRLVDVAVYCTNGVWEGY